MNRIDWAQMARPWLALEQQLEAAHQTVLDRLLSLAQLRGGQRVLDIGCGTGASLVAASRAEGETGHVIGIDIAPPLAARARERVDANADVMTADAQIIEAAGWSVTHGTEAFDLETNQSAEGLAKMHMCLASRTLLKSMDITDHDRAAIHTNLVDRFATFQTAEAINVPAEVHFFVATPR